MTVNLGREAFRINKDSFNNASSIWKAMFIGRCGESQQNEVELSDDTPAAFKVVMRVAHLQFDLLSSALSDPKLEELAKLCDKYGLLRLLRLIL